MKIIVDTCIWSLAFRRTENQNNEHVSRLSDLIMDQRVQLIGPIRQEILSGIQHVEQFNLLQKKLTAFPDLPIVTEDYEHAAELSNTLRKKGIQGSSIDFLICTLSHKHNMPIYTVDHDFIYFKKHIPIALFLLEN
ncbi:MAG: PIN domain-containing protein [Gammaproteobacteria bacterium]